MLRLSGKIEGFGGKKYGFGIYALTIRFSSEKYTLPMVYNSFLPLKYHYTLVV